MRGRKRVVVAKWVQRVGPALIAAFAVIEKKWPVAAYPSTRIRDILLSYFLGWNFIAVLVLVSLVLLAKAVEEFLEGSDTARLKTILDTLHATYFADFPANDRYQHRATLFKANRQNTLLEAVCRSGHLYPKGIQPLRISINDEAANEGVAGWAWVTDSTVYRTDLPEVPNPWSDGDPVCQQYAKDGLLPMQKAQKLRVKSRSVVATPVRRPDGAVWGVLVLDSRRPDGIDRTKEPIVSVFVRAISTVL
jgi:hypothetical protein